MRTLFFLLIGTILLAAAIFFGLREFVGFAPNENPMTLAIASGGLAGALMSLYSSSRTSGEARASRLASVRPYLHIVEDAKPFEWNFQPNRTYWGLERPRESILIENKDRGPAVNVRYAFSLENEFYDYEPRDSIVLKRFNFEITYFEKHRFLSLRSPIGAGMPVWLPDNEIARARSSQPEEKGHFGEPLYEDYTSVEIGEHLYLPLANAPQGKLAPIIEPGNSCILNVPVPMMWQVWLVAIVRAQALPESKNPYLKCVINFESTEGEKRSTTFYLSYRLNVKDCQLEDSVGQIKCRMTGVRSLANVTSQPRL